MVMGFVIIILHDAYGIGDGLKAPQANLMKIVSIGIFSNSYSDSELREKLEMQYEDNPNFLLANYSIAKNSTKSQSECKAYLKLILNLFESYTNINKKREI